MKTLLCLAVYCALVAFGVWGTGKYVDSRQENLFSPSMTRVCIDDPQLCREVCPEQTVAQRNQVGR